LNNQNEEFSVTDEDDLNAGVPFQKIANSIKEPITESPSRAGIEPSDNELLEEEQVGVPVQRPRDRIAVPDYRPPASAEVLGQGYENVSAEEATGLSRLLSSPVVSACFILLATAFSIVILSEVSQFIQTIQSAPTFVQIVAYACVLLLVMAFFFAMARLVIAYRRLKTTPQVQLEAIKSLSLRARTRDQTARQVDAGYDSLMEIVKDYPIGDAKHKRLLARCGLSEGEMKALASNISFLIKPDHSGKAKWIEDCDRLFVEVIDRPARQCVTNYSKRVGLKTAISPTGLIDSLIVVTNAVFMVEDLCRLYHVKTGRVQAIFLTGRICFSTFVSAKIEDRVDEIADTFFDGAIASIPEMSKEVFARITMGLLKRTAEGAVNMALFFRLGTATISSLRPIAISSKTNA